MDWDGKVIDVFHSARESNQHIAGVLYHLNTREAKLSKTERYIHTAMSKNGFCLVVTMHPKIAILIHKILSLNIDFTFERVEGKMDDWEVVGLVDRVKKRRFLSHCWYLSGL